ncbi:hypothetical protein PSTG_19079 [Puccinia striiformis f. sp. tritici PST-78]|uniref:Uncharacterized protein n=1 Tax=Puccinia striiformis f. sp. tritici PST-78 TaxID=1165861 RepID=A0A0L0UKM9_9BASI|nr:hypothetical protein PSTG_19079 [Puccinia striiformis f. sp. tritici PST-78]
MSGHESQDPSIPDTNPNDTRKLHAQVLQMKVKSTIHVPAKVNQRYVSKRQAGPQHGWAAYRGSSRLGEFWKVTSHKRGPSDGRPYGRLTNEQLCTKPALTSHA